MSDVNNITKSTGNDGAATVVNTSFNRFNILNLLFYIINSIATYSVQFGWVDLPSNGDLSDKYQTIVTPLGTSFLIWSVIFMWQLFWVIWQLLPSQRNSEGVLKAWYFYPIFTVCQAGWTFSFAFEIMWLSLLFMYGILFTLISASMSLQTYKKTWKGYLIWQGPFSIQTGWIMAASVLNTNVLPVFYEATATTRMVVASLSLAVLIITAFTWLSSYPVDFAIPCVILWALGGIYAELNAPLPAIPETFSERQINGVQNAVLAGMVLIGSGIISKALYVLFMQRPAALKAQEASAEDKEEPASASESEEAADSAEESV
jgi:benzodiazapine receptor